MKITLAQVCASQERILCGVAEPEDHRIIAEARKRQRRQESGIVWHIVFFLGLTLLFFL